MRAALLLILLALACGPLHAAVSITGFTCDPSGVPGGVRGQPGNQVLYRIQLSAAAAANVRAWETLPAQVTYIASSPGAAFAGGVVTWNFGAAAGVTAFEGWVLCQIASPLAYGTTVSAPVSAGSDSDPAVSGGPASFEVGPVSVTLAKSASPSSAGAGDMVTYKLDYTTGGYNLSGYDPLDTVGGLPTGWTSTGSCLGTWAVHSDGAGGGYIRADVADPNWGCWPQVVRDTPTDVCDGVFQADMYIDNGSSQDSVFIFRWIDSNTSYMIQAQSDSNGYRVQVNKSGQNYHGWVTGINQFTWYTCKVWAQGLRIRCKMWVRGTAEPGTWPLDITLPASEELPCAGAKVGFQSNEGPARYDNLYVYQACAVQQGTIWDTVPAGLSFQSAWGGAAPSGGLLAFGPRDWAASGSVTWTAQVQAPAACSSVITNFASLGGPMLTFTVQASAPLALFTCTMTNTPSPGPSGTLTNTPTMSASATPSATATATPSATATASPTASPSFSFSPTPSVSPTVSPTYTPTPLPLILHLWPSSPNPFGPAGVFLAFNLTTESEVTIKLFTVSGERVKDFEPRWFQRGNSEVFWDGKNQSGEPVASGVYLYKVRAVSRAGEETADFGKCAAVR